jgi:hypothetical protein
MVAPRDAPLQPFLTMCVPVEEPYARRVAPLHADTVARFAVIVAVTAGIPTLTERARARRSRQLDGDSCSAKLPG